MGGSAHQHRRQVNRDSAEQDVWQHARVELARAEAARHAYADHGRREARDDLAQSTQALQDAIRFIVQHADPDVRFAQQVGANLERYQQATDRSVAAVAAGNPSRAHRIDEQAVEPVAEELAEELEDGAQDEQEQAAASLATNAASSTRPSPTPSPACPTGPCRTTAPARRCAKPTASWSRPPWR